MTVGHFILGVYGILVLIAGFLVVKGVPLLEALFIFIFPTVIFAEYIWLMWRREKDPAYQNSIASQEILKMVQSNDAPAPPFDKVMATLEKEFGDGLNCDMRDYMGGAERE